MNYILAFFLTFAHASLPPTTLKNQDGVAKPTTFNFEVPHYQATRTGSTTGLIETGNNNLLLNPSFEDMTLATGWTTNGTVTANTTTYLDGKKAISVSLSAYTGTILEQSYSDCGRLDGIMLEAAVFAKTTLTNIEMCSLSGGTEVQCWPVDSSGAWKSTPLSFPGVASNSCGVRVKSTSSATGSIDFDAAYLGISRNIVSVLTEIPPTITKYTSGSGTYTPPAGLAYIRVKIVGGGGGGGGGGTSGNTGGGNGGNTTFGSSLLVANGGLGGGAGGGNGGSGGTASLALPAYGSAWSGGHGTFHTTLNTSGSGQYAKGGDGGQSCLAGGAGIRGSAAQANTGAGGAGGDNNNVNNPNFTGTGGGAGGCVDAIIPGPLAANYPYSVGTAGTAGGAGTNGIAGTAGGLGYIEITEFYDPSSTQAVKPSDSANLLGTIFAFPKSTCPANSVKLDGSTLSGAQYAALIAFNGTAVLQNWNALSPRGTGTQSINGRTKTGPASPGSLQEDQLQNHSHKAPYAAADSTGLYMFRQSAMTGQGTSMTLDGDLTQGGGISTARNVAGGNGRTGDETQGNSIGVTWCQWYVSTPAPMLSIGSSGVATEHTLRAEVVCGSSSSIVRQGGSWVTAISNISSNTCDLTVANGSFSASPTCVTSYNAAALANMVSTAQQVLSPTSVRVTCRYTDGTTVGVCGGASISILCTGPK